MAKERIGIMGGTFNPIHTGHIRMALAAKEQAGLDRVLVVPSGNPPHKHHIAPAEDRWKMVCAACAQEEALTPSRIELDREGVIYTVDTLTLLREEYPKADFFYIIGADTLMELHTWRRSDEVLKMCTFIVAPRPWDVTPAVLVEQRRTLEDKGACFISLDMEPMDVSSTDMRRALSETRAAADLPVPVREYCGVKGLYGMEARVPQAEEWLDKLFANGQVATQYVNEAGEPTMDEEWNVNGSYMAIEGITSPDGRVLGKMAHSERRDHGVAINIYGQQDIQIFESGVEYFK